MNDLLKALKQRIIDKVPKVKHVDRFNNQFEAMESGEFESFPFPCVFFEIEPFEWVPRLDGIYYADLRINVHIGVENYTGDDDEMFELVEQVNGALVRYTIKNCFSPIGKIDERPDNDHTSYSDHQVVFGTRYFDVSGWRQKDKIKKDLSKIEVGLKVDDPEFEKPEVVINKQP